MSKWAYYQDIDEQKCAWVRELIKAGAITDGEVDCRPIQSVTADDVRGFRRVHWFCGIAIWDYALNLAGWDDSRGVTWTGSCPCPSFSAAGKGAGFTDPRHLWPDWFRLIRECRPATVFGEQVESAIGHGWLDLVWSDLENEDYAVGAAVLGACSVGAPHRRQRLWFVASRMADAGSAQSGGLSGRRREAMAEIGRGSKDVLMAYAEHAGHGRPPERAAAEPDSDQPGERIPDGDCAADIVGDSTSEGLPQWSGEPVSGRQARGELGDPGSEGLPQRERDRRVQPGTMGARAGQASERGGHADYWRDPIWIPCRDGKWRPLPRVADAGNAERWPGAIGRSDDNAAQGGRHEGASGAGECCATDVVGNAELCGLERIEEQRSPSVQPEMDGAGESQQAISPRDSGAIGIHGPAQSGPFALPAITSADLGYMRLASGETCVAPLIQKGKARVMRLRGYGDAINAQVAKTFIQSCIESLDDSL